MGSAPTEPPYGYHELAIAEYRELNLVMLLDYTMELTIKYWKKPAKSIIQLPDATAEKDQAARRDKHMRGHRQDNLVLERAGFRVVRLYPELNRRVVCSRWLADYVHEKRARDLHKGVLLPREKRINLPLSDVWDSLRELMGGYVDDLSVQLGWQCPLGQRRDLIPHGQTLADAHRDYRTVRDSLISYSNQSQRSLASHPESGLSDEDYLDPRPFPPVVCLPADLRGAESAGVRAAKKRRRTKNQMQQKAAEAEVLLEKYPDMTVQDIAERIGLSRQQLHESRAFERFRTKLNLVRAYGEDQRESHSQGMIKHGDDADTVEQWDKKSLPDKDRLQMQANRARKGRSPDDRDDHDD